MSDKRLNGVKVAILATDGFEQVELTEPKKAIEAAGGVAHVVSPKSGTIKAWDTDHWGIEVPVDAKLSDADPADYDALQLPGGAMNPDKLRRNEAALAFIRHFFDAAKPVAAICHAPWSLIDAGVVKGRKMTSYESIQTDLKNAGADWVDESVVVDGNLITSRNPGDLPIFNEKLTEAFCRTRHPEGECGGGIREAAKRVQAALTPSGV